MKIAEYKYGAVFQSEPCVLALGFFDGVHLAHRELLKAARAEADKRAVPLAVFTFPAECSFLKGGAGRIYGTPEKIKILEELKVDICIIADFTSLASLSAEDFINNVIIRDIDAAVAVSGYNFRYGKGAHGDAELLVKAMKKNERDALVLDAYTIEGRAVSSSLIREYIKSADIRNANILLGSRYFFCGKVEHGRGEGHRFGFPTINIELSPQRQVPRLGVYKTILPIDGKDYIGLTNIGICPTFGKRAVHLETYILGYEGNLYDKELCIFFEDFIRDEMHFSSKEELIMQIKIDIDTILNEDTNT